MNKEETRVHNLTRVHHLSDCPVYGDYPKDDVPCCCGRFEETEFLLDEFRKIQDEHFENKTGESYRGNIISHTTMELMLKIINGLDGHINRIKVNSNE